VRHRVDRPQALLGHSFGGLVALRYLETQPSDPVAAAVISSPWLGLASAPAAWKRIAARLLADLWPTLPFAVDLDLDHLSRDPTVSEAYQRDPALARPRLDRRTRLCSCPVATSAATAAGGPSKRRTAGGMLVA